jgi:hypothetical protein
MDEVLATALHKLFYTLKIRAHSVVFLLLDDTIIKKTGKKIPGCGWYKDHAQNLANVFGHQWVLAALFYKQALLPLGARLYYPKGAKEKRGRCFRVNLQIPFQGARLYYPKGAKEKRRRWKRGDVVSE